MSQLTDHLVTFGQRRLQAMRIVCVDQIAAAPQLREDSQHRAGIDRRDPRDGMDVDSEFSRLADQPGISAGNQSLPDLAERPKLLHQESCLVLTAAVLPGRIDVQDVQEIHPRKLSGGH